MKSSIGDNIHVTLFGESHGETIGTVIDGLAPGIPIDQAYIHKQLDKRQPRGKISSNRLTGDKFHIISGVYSGYTTGTPLCILIPNTDHMSEDDFDRARGELRPSHADFVAFEKYLGYQDHRGGGHFSGRITAPLVAAGAICAQVLATRDIHIGTHVARCHHISDADLPQEAAELVKQIRRFNNSAFPTVDPTKARQMQAVIESICSEGDSVGGVLETAVVGMPTGVGEPYFHSIESNLSSLLFSVPAVKGVEFGLGFRFVGLLGSEANDPFFMDGDCIRTCTNHNGGINGGVSNSMPILLRCAIKPTPSIYKEQQTVDYLGKRNIVQQIIGRHDPAIFTRARVVVDSMVAIGLLDLLCERQAALWMAGPGH